MRRTSARPLLASAIVVVILVASSSVRADPPRSMESGSGTDARIGAEVGFGALTGAVGVGLSFLVWSFDRSGCGDDSLCSLGGPVIGSLGGAAIALIGTPLAVGLGHGGLGGRGGNGWMLLGGLVGLAAGLGSGAAIGVAWRTEHPSEGAAAAAIAAALGELGYLAGLVIAIEVDHTSASPLEIAPGPGGITVAGRF